MLVLAASRGRLFGAGTPHHLRYGCFWSRCPGENYQQNPFNTKSLRSSPALYLASVDHANVCTYTNPFHAPSSRCFLFLLQKSLFCSAQRKKNANRCMHVNHPLLLTPARRANPPCSPFTRSAGSSMAPTHRPINSDKNINVSATRYNTTAPRRSQTARQPPTHHGIKMHASPKSSSQKATAIICMHHRKVRRKRLGAPPFNSVGR